MLIPSPSATTAEMSSAAMALINPIMMRFIISIAIRAGFLHYAFAMAA